MNEPDASALSRITDAAAALLRDPSVGRDRISLSGVARRAGVPTGVVYRHFSSRADLLDRVWPDRRDSFLRSTEARDSLSPGEVP